MLTSLRPHGPVLLALLAVVAIAFGRLVTTPLWDPLDSQIVYDAHALSLDPSSMFNHLGFYFSQPLLQLAFLAEYHFFGLNTSGYLAVNLAMHGFNSFMVYMLVNMLFPRRSMAILASILFALVWVPRRLFGRLKITPHLGVRVWPLVSILALVGFVAVFVVGLADAIPRLGQVTVYSVGQMVLSIVFAATALWALVAVLRARNARMNRIVWWHSLVVAASANSIALYLLYWGLIGLRTWSY